MRLSSLAAFLFSGVRVILILLLQLVPLLSAAVLSRCRSTEPLYKYNQYLGYDHVPRTYVSATSCEMSNNQLSIHLTNFNLTNHSTYIEVTVDIICFNNSTTSQLSNSGSSCKDCIEASTDEEVKSSSASCNDCIHTNQSVFSIWWQSVGKSEQPKQKEYTIKIPTTNNADTSDIKCYLYSCGSISIGDLYQFKSFPINCPTSDTTITTSTSSSNTYSNHQATTTGTLSPRSMPYLSTAVKSNTSTPTSHSIAIPTSLLTSLTTKDVSTITPTAPQVVAPTTLNHFSSSKLTTTVETFSSSSNTQQPSSTSKDSSTDTPNFSYLILVIVAISLVFIVAAVVLVGFILIYRNWTNKLGNGNNKNVEDKHLEEAVHLRVGFESSKRDDTASVTSVVTLVQELCRPSAIITSETPFSSNKREQIGSHTVHNTMSNFMEPAVIHTLSSSPYTMRKITMETEDNAYAKLAISGDYESSSHHEYSSNHVPFNTHTTVHHADDPHNSSANNSETPYMKFYKTNSEGYYTNPNDILGL